MDLFMKVLNGSNGHIVVILHYVDDQSQASATTI